MTALARTQFVTQPLEQANDMGGAQPSRLRASTHVLQHLWLRYAVVLAALGALVGAAVSHARNIHWTPFKVILAIAVVVAPGGMLLCPLLFKGAVTNASPDVRGTV